MHITKCQPYYEYISVLIRILTAHAASQFYSSPSHASIVMLNASQPTVDIVTDRTTHALEEPPGAILVGVFIQFFFQGIIVIEAGQYYEVCYEDSWGRNLFVAFVTLLSV